MQKQMRGFSVYVFMWSYFPYYNHAQHINSAFYCLRHVNLSRTTYNFQCKVIWLYNAKRNKIRTWNYTIQKMLRTMETKFSITRQVLQLILFLHKFNFLCNIKAIFRNIKITISCPSFIQMCIDKYESKIKMVQLKILLY